MAESNMSPQERAYYLGLYELMAWTQGYNQAITKFCFPDVAYSVWMEGAPTFRPSLFKFWDVVSDYDEGAIHLFRVHDASDNNGSIVLEMACTEDDTVPKDNEPKGSNPIDHFQTAGWHYTVLKEDTEKV